MMGQVLYGAAVFDGTSLSPDLAVVLDGSRIAGLVPVAERPRGLPAVDLGGGILSPGLIDIQVNGGGGVLFNDTPTPEGIAEILAAHRRFGTTSLLPTVITDRPAVLHAALAAARRAQGLDQGALGIHVEGPFIDPKRPGAHPKPLIRPMLEEDAAALIAARSGVLLVTLAPASVPMRLIRRLCEAGIVVSLGHAEAASREAIEACAMGARAVTHLFNAMSQLGGRAPGLVGAALAEPALVCGLIADGHHVDALALRIAYAAKGAAGIALISDAMPPAAGGPDHFDLGGRRATMSGGRLVLDDGTLAGAAITLLDGVRCMASLGIPLADALRMATLTPARLLRLEASLGRIAPGCTADLIHLDDGLALRQVWMKGQPA